MYKSFIISIFLCATAIGASAQPHWQRADSLRQAGNLGLAAVEYERCAYLAESQADYRRALEMKALCLKAGGDYARAAQTVGRYATRYADYYQQGLCLLLAGEAQGASDVLGRCRMLCDTVKADVLLLQVLALNELQLYDSARTVALQLASGAGAAALAAVDSIYGAVPRLKKERTARWLSYVPGLGHCYAGEYAVGATSFVLNAALLGFGVWQVFERCYITAYMGGAGLLSATFTGSMRSAEYYVRKHNYRLTRAFNEGARRTLLEVF